MATRREPIQKRNGNRRKKQHRRLLWAVFPVAGLLLLLFFLLRTPLHRAPIPDVDASLLDARKDRIAFAQDRIFTVVKANGDTVFQKSLAFRPTHIFAEKDFFAAANEDHLLITDARGEQDAQIALPVSADYITKTDEGILVLSDRRLIRYDKNGEIQGDEQADGPLITAGKRGDSLLVTAGSITADGVKSALYEEKEGTLQMLFPVFDDVILDYAKQGDRTAVATSRAVYLLGEKLVRVPVEKYRGIHLDDRLYVLDGQTLRMLDWDGMPIKETDTPADYTQMIGAGDTLILWNAHGFAVYDKEGERLTEKTFSVRKIVESDGLITVFGEELAMQGNAKAWEKE